MAESSGENVCDFKGCGKKFKKKQRLIEHKRSHTGERPCLCTECNKTFVREMHLKRHLLSHNGTKPYSCSYAGCNLMFTTKHFMKRHQERAHNRPFKCTYEGCDKTFNKRNHLKIHTYVHTKETPFRCKERGCHYSFDTPTKLRKHTKLHDMGFHNYFPRKRNDLHAHRWLKKHIISHKCPIFCPC
ncbi:transcription factor IIIA [Exaiptasia diaphana]|uniref:C2H2-type domain-containing protein n=1 Tax=Exaiptasia diaphana TaxID=2652724 RepID=A0A913XVJ0_EXADI|nr:transcription factor IIIA [Exaiptasia diaphana]KXJ08708.1 Transcription factor IIIA [Exaiptasia diaphana]